MDALVWGKRLPVSENGRRVPLYRILWVHVCGIGRLIVVRAEVRRPVMVVVPRVGCDCTYSAAKRCPGQTSYRGTGESAKSPSTESADGCTAKGT